MPVPKRFGDEEVVVFNLSSEGGWGNVENCLTSVEVVEVSGDLIAGDLPGWVFSIGVEWMLHVCPSIVEPLDGVVVWLLTHGDD